MLVVGCVIMLTTLVRHLGCSVRPTHALSPARQRDRRRYYPLHSPQKQPLPFWHLVAPPGATRRHSLMGTGSVSASSNTSRPTGMDQRHPSHQRQTAESRTGGKRGVPETCGRPAWRRVDPGRRGRRPNLPLNRGRLKRGVFFVLPRDLSSPGISPPFQMCSLTKAQCCAEYYVVASALGSPQSHTVGEFTLASEDASLPTPSPIL